MVPTNIIRLDPRAWIMRNVVRALTPKDHDPQQWALAVIDGCEACGHALTLDELEMILQQSAAPIPAGEMVDDICNFAAYNQETTE
jgi:hypothetical protein